MREVDIAIIGGGAAGMAAAVGAYKAGIKDILILERNDSLGGVLHQCIHNGFGLHRFQEDLTGVEFAQRYQDMVAERKITYMLRTFVIDLNKDKIITAVNPKQGLIKIRAKAVILAMGCRERSRNNLLIPGTRGAGILTAGTAQRYLNLDGYLPGKKVVILGSGDIGLIMARQFVLEGVSVEAVVEVMPYSGGLPRNMKQCIEDFDIPVYYNSTVSKICGRERVSSVWISQVDENRRPVEGTEFEVECDTLMISAGLIPENELTEQAGIAISPVTKGAVVTEDNQTSVRGIFSCGNVLHVHDLVDFVSEEGEETGAFAAAYVMEDEALSASEQSSADRTCVRIKSGNGAGGVVPQLVRKDTARETVSFMFRPKAKFKDVKITVTSQGKEIFSKPRAAVSPGEMCKITVGAELLRQAADILEIGIQEAEHV